MPPPEKKVEVDGRRLPYYDSRSPRYYELRAGHPEAHADFYRNTQADGSLKPAEFSKEKIVVGFNTTVGVFHEHWKVLLDVMLKEKLYETDFHKDKNAEYELWPHYAKIYTDERFKTFVNGKKSAKWAHDMVWGTIFAAKNYVEKYHHKFEEDGSWPMAQWSWGPECLTPMDYSDEVMQYQHLVIRIFFISWSTDATPQVDVKGFPAHYLLYDIPAQNARYTPVDVKLEQFSFDRLVRTLKHKDVGMLDDGEHDVARMRIYWKWDDEEIDISNQQELCAAVSRQRDQKKWEVSIIVRPRD